MEPASSGCVLDSSVWVALFLDGDTNHDKALAGFGEITGTIYVPYVVLSEVANVLVYKHSKEQADAFVSFVVSDARCVILESSYSVDITAFLAVHKKISFADMAIIATARTLGVALLTFDEQMRRVFAVK